MLFEILLGYNTIVIVFHLKIPNYGYSLFRIIEIRNKRTRSFYSNKSLSFINYKYYKILVYNDKKLCNMWILIDFIL